MERAGKADTHRFFMVQQTFYLKKICKCSTSDGLHFTAVRNMIPGGKFDVDQEKFTFLSNFDTTSIGL